MLQEKIERIYSSSREYIIFKKNNSGNTHIHSGHRNDNVIYYECVFYSKNIDLFKKNALQDECILFPCTIYLYQKIDGLGFV